MKHAVKIFRGWGFGLLAAAALSAPSARAQTPVSNLVFAVGTTIRDVSNNDWSYVLLGSPQAQLLAGKKFAIYSKPGAATNSAAFTLRATLFQQTNTNAINTLLNQSGSIGQSLAGLQASLMAVLHNYPAVSNQTVAQNVLLAFQLAQNDPGVAQSLRLAAGINPGLELCLGQAFAEQIAGVTTYEIRDVNAATGVAGDVIGRVTITPGAPTILPAPGTPFQVVSNTPRDDLRIRLRWGQPDALLRLGLLNYGFNVWRIPKAPAEAGGYNVTPPTAAVLLSNTNFTRANNGPTMAGKYFSAGSGAGAANDPADRTTYFFTDGRAFGQNLFADGDLYYYFVTARDVLGRDGLVSPGTLAQACRRDPPVAPRGVKIANMIQNTNQQRLQISWQQNTNPADNVTEYWIYRWPNPSMALTNDPTSLVNRAGVVSQLPGTNLNLFIDTGAGAPTVPGVSNYWYSVCAVVQSACGPLVSPPTPPAWGVLRERTAPAATTGTISGSCGTPVVMFQTLNSLINDAGPDTTNWNYRFTCYRRDPGIAWVQYFVTNSVNLPEVIGPLYFPPAGNTAQFDYSIPVTGTNYLINIGCVVGTYYGQTSAPALFSFTAPTPSGLRQEAVFNAGELLATALSSTDPLLTYYNGGAPAFFSPTSAKADPSGTVRLTFAIAPGRPVLLQVFSNSAWADLGVFNPDTNFVYWISYPACLLGPLPPFRGAGVLLPGDCNQHIARGADGGPVAPVHVRFGLTPGTHEYRLFRTVDGGPLSLFAHGAALYDINNPGNQIVRTDDAMPASQSRIGYFVQLLNEHGHGSPISLMGFRNIKPAKLPQPVLAQPLAAGSITNPQVALSWYCATSGVYRFSIKIARNDQQGSGKPTGITSLSALREFQLTTQPNYNRGATYLGLFSRRLAMLRFDEDQLTPVCGSNFGPGPAFNITVGLTANVPYTIAVAAVDAQGNEGDVSQAWNFTWVPPLQPQNVPWPARPFPNVSSFDDPSTNQPRVAAVLLNTNGVMDATWPVGIRIGNLFPLANSLYSTTVCTTNFFSYGGFGALPDPSQLIWRRFSSDASKRGDLLLPIVVYRQQVPSTNFPVVSGNLIQVTPLIEHLPTIAAGRFPTLTIPDLLIGAGSEPPPFNGSFSFPASYYTYLYVRDQQPVAHGATYQYYVARFDQKHEVSEIINAGQVSIP